MPIVAPVPDSDPAMWEVDSSYLLSEPSYVVDTAAITSFIEVLNIVGLPDLAAEVAYVIAPRRDVMRCMTVDGTIDGATCPETALCNVHYADVGYVAEVRRWAAANDCYFLLMLDFTHLDYTLACRVCGGVIEPILLETLVLGDLVADATLEATALVP